MTWNIRAPERWNTLNCGQSGKILHVSPVLRSITYSTVLDTVHTSTNKTPFLYNWSG